MPKIHDLYIHGPSLDQIIQHATNGFKLDLQGTHGLPHWLRVNQRALKLAEVTGANRQVVTLFAYLHDACREDEHEDPQHGQRGAANAMALSAIYDLQLSDPDKMLLHDAIFDHSEGKLSDEPTIATCWDADRLDLWRVGITPAARFLSTEAAKTMLKYEIKYQLYAN